nr:hypothetical protein CFP56_27153 [Quercus suber]
MSEEQHRELKLFDNIRHKLHLSVSKILDEMQTRTMLFRDRNGIDSLGFGFGIGLGFGFRIGLSTTQMIKVVWLLISLARCVRER